MGEGSTTGKASDDNDSDVSGLSSGLHAGVIFGKWFASGLDIGAVVGRGLSSVR